MAVLPEEHHFKVGKPEPCGREGHGRDVAKQFLQFTGAEDTGGVLPLVCNWEIVA